MSTTNFQENKDGLSRKLSPLLESAASDDLSTFIHQIEQHPFEINEFSFWYCRKLGSKQMGFEQRSPLMIASTYGSLNVVNYIINSGKVDVNEKSCTDYATPLHCAAAGCSNSSLETIKILLAASADVNSVDVNGKRPCDVIPLDCKFTNLSKRKELEVLLGGCKDIDTEIPQCVEKKESVGDVMLPDMNVGVYASDEFRMYSFKVKPCSRAYTHDWTECPFVHPGENARRRDLSKYSYSCVPCLEFKKGSCLKGDDCEYAHGVFESWLHPAQYKTRLCKDEVGCGRKVCFFAHKKEELRPVYASTGSAMPSTNMGPSSPIGSPVVASSSPMSGRQKNGTLSPPKMQLQGSRLKAGSIAREMELERELLELESVRIQQHRQQMIDNFSSMSAKPMWNNNRSGEIKGTNLDEVFGSLDSSYLSPQMQSPTSHQLRSQNMNQQLRASYSSNIASSPSRKPAYGFDSSAAVAAAVINARSSAIASRSHSFVDRGAVSHPPPGFTSSTANSTAMMSSNLSDLSSSGKLNWGYQGDDLNKLRKSMSFAFPNASSAKRNPDMTPYIADEPDVSWVNSLVKDVSSSGAGLYNTEHRHGLEGVHEMLPLWAKA